MKVALAQFNPTVGDFEGNRRRMLVMAGESRRRGADLVIFPELGICGYPPWDLVENPGFIERNRQSLEQLARELPDVAALVGYVSRRTSHQGKPHANAAAFLTDGRVVFEQHKMLLPTYDVFDEERYFEPAQSQSVYLFENVPMGITICEDVWNDKNFWKHQLYLRNPVEELIRQGAGMLINISASPYNMDKRQFRLEMFRNIARTYRRPVVFVNQVGGQDSLLFDGSSVALDAEGRVCAQAGSFEEDLVVFDTASCLGEIHPQPEDELEAVYRALVMGTRDYVMKCGFEKVLVGLSGGIDSSLVAAVAVAALGTANVLGMSMPGPYSSPGSVTDAQTLAKNLAISLISIPIGPIFNSYRATLAEPFAGKQEDVTEENIQARIRGNLLMAISNKFAALVLSTGNKSELAVGYCTLYGDMAGGLAVISDIPKTMVYSLARWINREREVIPEVCLRKPPSAELRPNQTDQDSLPPYDVLDRILKSYIEEAQGPREIADHYGFEISLVEDVIRRVNRNEYKRQQAPPGLKVTSKAFGVGRRFPVAQRYFA